MRNLLAILTVLALMSCNSHLDKPIFEKLEVSELKKSIDNDSTFKTTYEYILYVRDTIIKSDMEKVEFADLTYERVHDLMEFASDTTHFNPIRQEIEEEWEKKYGRYDKKVDSISNYWKKYMEENSLERFVKIELAEIYKEYYSYSNGIKNINLGFKITPLKGKIDQLRFSYIIKAKIYEDEEDEYSSIFSSLDKSWCLTTDPITKPVTRYWEVNYSNEKLLKSENLTTFNRDYNIFIEVDEIRKDGVNLSVDDLEIPKVVSNHWDSKDDKLLEGVYKDDIIIEFIDKDYVSEYEYRRNRVNEILKEEDPLAFKFLNLPFESVQK